MIHEYKNEEYKNGKMKIVVEYTEGCKAIKQYFVKCCISFCCFSYLNINSKFIEAMPCRTPRVGPVQLMCRCSSKDATLREVISIDS